MAARLIDWGVVRSASYLMLEMDGDSIAGAQRWLDEWARTRGHEAEIGSRSIRILGGTAALRIDVAVEFVQAEAGECLARADEPLGFDLVVANAFLDLVDVSALLPALFARASSRALYWFSVNFDGDTIFEPAHEDDRALLDVYHRTMDDRLRDGKPAGDSRSGRHLFAQLWAAGAEVLCAGASDWVVYPQDRQYDADEAYFLHHIIDTIDQALRVRRDVDQDALSRWIALRHDHIEQGCLVYVAHQLDFLGRAPARASAQ